MGEIKASGVQSPPPDQQEGCQAQLWSRTHDPSYPPTDPLFNGRHDLPQVVGWEGLRQKIVKLCVRHQDMHHLPAIKPATGRRETATGMHQKLALQLHTVFYF